MKGKRIKSLALAAVPLVAFIVFCNMGRFKYDPSWPGENDYFIGLGYYDDWRYAEARPYMLKALEANPNNGDILNLLGVIDTQLGKFDSALSWYDRAIAAKPDAMNLYMKRGAILESLGRYDEAIKVYRRAIELFPGWNTPAESLQAIQDKLESEE